MTLPASRRLFLESVGGAVLVLGLASCRLQREGVHPRTFLLQGGIPDAAPAETRTGGVGILLVRPCRVDPPSDSKAFILRRGESEFTPDPYNAFLVSPGAMMTEAVARWARSIGVFAMVTTGGSQLSPTHALECDLEALWGDYRDPARSLAVLAMRVRMLHPLGGREPKISWERVEQREVVLPRGSADHLVAGWNQGLHEILGVLEGVLREAGSQSGPGTL